MENVSSKVKRLGVELELEDRRRLDRAVFNLKQEGHPASLKAVVHNLLDFLPEVERRFREGRAA